MPHIELDFRKGGTFFFKVELPDGSEIWSKSIFMDIVDQQKIVLNSFFTDEYGNSLNGSSIADTIITLLFEDTDAKTQLTILHQGLPSDTHTREEYSQGWNQSLDRLDAML